MKLLGIAVTTAWVIAAILFLLEAPLWAGAHPFWANQVLLSGVVLGTLLAVATVRIARRPAAIGFGLISTAAFFVAYYGKGRFAASFADDTFGGQLWYFGWHAFCIFAVAGIITTTHQLLVRSDR